MPASMRLSRPHLVISSLRRLTARELMHSLSTAPPFLSIELLLRLSSRRLCVSFTASSTPRVPLAPMPVPAMPRALRGQPPLSSFTRELPQALPRLLPLRYSWRRLRCSSSHLRMDLPPVVPNEQKLRSRMARLRLRMKPFMRLARPLSSTLLFARRSSTTFWFLASTCAMKKQISCAWPVPLRLNAPHRSWPFSAFRNATAPFFFSSLPSRSSDSRNWFFARYVFKPAADLPVRPTFLRLICFSWWPSIQKRVPRASMPSLPFSRGLSERFNFARVRFSSKNSSPDLGW
mmetsp:Transcript_1381/g.4956  ORF Transcript_1381/g.4956 Transcript_1381/m.4956 type:complete len:290 (+) Transcript_1381:520-1389(+)